MRALQGYRRTWVEVDSEALGQNLRALASRLRQGTLLAPVVKSNAYGHGIHLSAEAFLRAGADWLCVDSLHEAIVLREAGLFAPILVLGFVPPAHAEALVANDLRAVAYLDEQLDAFSRASCALSKTTKLHIKVETGTHRQGLALEDAMAFGEKISALPGLRLEGISSHFADIEDTTDHRFAKQQLQRFTEIYSSFCALGVHPMRTISNSAATILWSEAHFELVRPGISIYGMWPSKETLLSALLSGDAPIRLAPALRWCTQIAQVKRVKRGGAIGYGCSYHCTHDSLIAVIPVGYYDGYDRGLSNRAHVLIRGQRAYVRGRVCMNMIMVDVTDIDGACPGDEVVLLGAQGEERIDASTMADWADTINYEITTRIHEGIPRIPIHKRNEVEE